MRIFKRKKIKENIDPLRVAQTVSGLNFFDRYRQFRNFCY